MAGYHYITLHYITVFSAGPTTTRTGPAIQVEILPSSWSPIVKYSVIILTVRRKKR